MLPFYVGVEQSVAPKED